MSGIVSRLVPGLGRVATERDEARDEADFLRSELELRLQRIAQLKASLEKSRRLVTAHEHTLGSLRTEVELLRAGLVEEAVEEAVEKAVLPAVEPVPIPPRHLFVMTYGRSGSTLLQAVLNSIPGYLIRGDNGGIVPHLFQFHRDALAQKTQLSFRADWPGHPKFGMNDYPDRAALDEIRGLVTGALLRPEPDTRVVGFKEIRWYLDCLPEYVAFLCELFPGARFVVNTREITDTEESRWWGEDDTAQTIGEVEDRIFEVARALGDDCFHLVYDDYAADPEELRPLFAWLGEEFDRARVDDVMAIRYSSLPD